MVMCVQVYGYLVSKFIFSFGDLLFLESQQTLPYFCQEKGFVGRWSINNKLKSSTAWNVYINDSAPSMFPSCPLQICGKYGFMGFPECTQ